MTVVTLEAVIWDMDGVLVDSKEYHYQSWAETYSQFCKGDQPLSRSIFESLFGMRNAETVRRMFGQKQATPEFIATVSELKEALFRESIRGNLDPMPGVRQWLVHFQEIGIGQALASSAPEANIDTILDEIRARQYFDVVLSAESRAALRSKPAPDIFFETASLLQVSPHQCLVIEDSTVGVQAANTAGMVCLAISSTHQAGKLSGADWVIDGFVDQSPDTMIEMWQRWSLS